MKKLALLLVTLIAILTPVTFSAETIQDLAPTGQVSVVPLIETERGTEASPCTHLPAPAPAPSFALVRSPGAVTVLQAAKSRASPPRPTTPEAGAAIQFHYLHKERSMTEETAAGTAQYLTFILDGEVFALNITAVREVLDFTSVTKVPQTPDYMRGVINLRGRVVPVMDLRSAFGMPATATTVNSCIIISEMMQDGEPIILGAMADSVQEVLDLDPDQIEPPPHIGTHLKSDFILGMGKQGEQFVMLLDIEKVFSGQELAQAAIITETALAAA